MDSFLQQKEETKVTRHYGIVMAFAIVGASIVGIFLMWGYWNTVTTYTSDNQTVETIATSKYGRYAPVELFIPSLDVRVGFVDPLGLEADQTIMVPDSYTEVGWYKHGATPGEIGSAVILGHVDSQDGPAVFYTLGQLKRGEEIEVKRTDGSVAVFVVDGLERVNQDNFPTEKVYGAHDEAVLRLVTCSGTFDRGAQRYSHNLVVYASLKP